MVDLNVGKSYQAKVSVTNRSSQGGQLAAATLLVEVRVALSGQTIQGLYGPASYLASIDFGPGETRIVPLNFDIGWDKGDQPGQIAASVKAPDGTLLKSGALDFYVRIAYVAPAWVYPLTSGWNVLSYQGPEGPASNIMASILPYLVIAYIWDEGAQKYEQVVTDTIIRKDYALQINVTQAVSWTVDVQPAYVEPEPAVVLSSVPKVVWEMALRAGDNAFMYDGPTGKASDLMASILPYLVIAYYYTDPAKGWQQVLADTILQRTEVVSTYVGYSMTLNVKVSQDTVWHIIA